MPTRNAHNSRPAFTLVPLALILWIALLIIGVLLWQKTPPPNYVPAKGVGPGQIGSVILAVLYGGFWFWSLGKLAEKKGQIPANLAAVIVMGLAALMMSLSYFGLTADQRNLAKNTPSQTTPQPGTAAPSIPPAPSPSGPLVQRPPSNAAPSNRVPAPSADRPVVDPAQTTQSPPAPRRDPTPAHPPQPAEHPGIATVKAAFEKELNDQIASFIQLADKSVPPLATQVAHDLRQVNARLTDIQALKSQAQTLAKSLRSADETIRARMQQAGVPSNDAFHASVRWSMDYSATTRAFAAERYSELANRAIEELTLLRDNFGKWTLTSKGELKVTDNALKSKLGSLRFFVESDAGRHQSNRDGLTGK